MSLTFVPGFTPSSPRFLGRFLSPLPDGVAGHYLQAFSRPGDIVLDPFGQAPSVAVEALSLGRRVVVTSLNPILRLALSLAVRPPALADLKSALTALGDAPVGPGAGDRLEVQIKAMYATTCAECQAPVTADWYEWEDGVLLAKHYVCLKCGGPKDAPTDADDRQLAARFTRSGPDYHFLLGRTANPDDAEPGRADETLAIYPPRTIAAIARVLHKLENLELDPEPRRLLAGMLAAAFDATTALAQERPKVPSVPRRYHETNFWHALESALGILAGPATPDQSATLDDLLAHTGEAAVYAQAGSMRDLATRLPVASCALILTAPPRPNPVFWTLSVAWAGWLWGRESAETLRATLHRRRYDWTWHARALHQSLAAAQRVLAPDGRLVCLLAEAEPGFNASIIAAAAGAGYLLRGWVLRADTAEAQLEFAPGDAAMPLSDPAPAVREAAAQLLSARAEPSRWSSLHFEAWCHLAAVSGIAWNPDEPLAQVNQAILEAVSDGRLFQHFNEGAADEPTSGLWFLATAASATGPSSRPLADRVEAEVVRCLSGREPVDENDLLREVYAALPADLTPGKALVMACLASYAVQDEAGLWRLRPEDAPAARAGELQSTLAELRALAGRQGFEATPGNPQEWRDGGECVYLFAASSSAVIGGYLLGPQRPARRRFLVLPGGRAGLVEHKLRRDPRLRQAVTAGDWTLVKFRQVRQMLADSGLTRATLEPTLAGDPLEALQQMALPERGDSRA